jgi:hypothetical protein
MKRREAIKAASALLCNTSAGILGDVWSAEVRGGVAVGARECGHEIRTG